MKKPKSGWEFQEAGWWTHDLMGGVVKEGKGWGCYPLDLADDSPAHSAPNRTAAMQWIERRYAKNMTCHDRQGTTPNHPKET